MRSRPIPIRRCSRPSPREGLGADVVSGGEYRRARAAGIAAGPDRLLRSRQDRGGDGARARGRPLPVQPRIAAGSRDAVGGRARDGPDGAGRASGSIPTSRPGRHAKISTGAAHNKFGMAIADAAAAYDRVARPARPPAQRRRGPYRQPADQPRPARGGVRKARRADPRAARRRARHRAPPISAAASASPTIRPRRRRRRPADYGAMVARVTPAAGTSRLIFEPGRLHRRQCRRASDQGDPGQAGRRPIPSSSSTRR